MARFGLLMLAQGTNLTQSCMIPTISANGKYKSANESPPMVIYGGWMEKVPIWRPNHNLYFKQIWCQMRLMICLQRLEKNDQKIYVVPSQNLVVVDVWVIQEISLCWRYHLSITNCGGSWMMFLWNTFCFWKWNRESVTFYPNPSLTEIFHSVASTPDLNSE